MLFLVCLPLNAMQCSIKLFFTEYAKWWAPIAEDIIIDKSKGKKPTMTQNANGKEVRNFI